MLSNRDNKTSKAKGFSISDMDGNVIYNLFIYSGGGSTEARIVAVGLNITFLLSYRMI